MGARSPWPATVSILGTLSKDVFEARTSTGSEAFSLFICLDANKLVLLSFFSLLKTIYPRVSTKSFPSDAKSPLPFDVRRSKTLLLKLPIYEKQRPSPCNGIFFPRNGKGQLRSVQRDIYSKDIALYEECVILQMWRRGRGDLRRCYFLANKNRPGNIT